MQHFVKQIAPSASMIFAFANGFSFATIPASCRPTFQALFMLTVKNLAIPDVKLLMPKMHRDHRGYLAEVLSERKMLELGLPRFVQENQSLSLNKNVVRGLHMQKPPHAQAKLVRVLRGKIFDVAVDVRAGSSTYGQHVTAVLESEGDITQMYIPPGFLHGFCTLTDDTIVLYRMSDYYTPGSEIGTLWNDPDLKIHWPVKASDAILSDKDTRLPSFKDFPKVEL
jgi:dTDP-4-dehydrorhamnose 3,5-epimerase